MSYQTFVLLKPDALQRQLEEPILTLILQKGYRIIKRKQVVVTKSTILRHYAEVIERIGKGPFKNYVLQEFVGQTITALLLESDSPTIIEDVRKLIGSTDPVLADKQSIRGLFGNDSLAKARVEERMLRNLIHASDSHEAVNNETILWFK